MRPARRPPRGRATRGLRAGAPRSPLEGVPLSIKDSIHVAGLPSTWGSRALADFRPDIDELPVARLRAAGAIILGKTNVPELTLEGYTSNDLFGVTRNPWDTRLTPGGSSGGAAASVAAGLVPAAIGADGGGSIRRPACHTGLVGWKPSTGHVPRIDGFPAILTDLETIGTLTPHGRRRADCSTRSWRVPMRAIAARSTRRRRAGRTTRPRIVYIPKFGEGPVDPEVAAAIVADFARSLEREGCKSSRKRVFFDLEDAARIWHVLSRAGVAWLMRGTRLARGRRRRLRARDGGGRPQAHGRRLYRRARARRRLPPPLRRAVCTTSTSSSRRPRRRCRGRPRRPIPTGSPAGRRGRATTRSSPAGSTSPALPAISLPIGVSAIRPADRRAARRRLRRRRCPARLCARRLARAIRPPAAPRHWRTDHEHRVLPAGISCKSPGPPTCPTACCARSPSRRSTIAAPASPTSAARC